MPKSANQKLKLLYIHKMLLEKTDENHLIGVNDIIRELGRYNIKAERKTIYADLEALKQYGVDIISRKNKTTGYFIASRRFDLVELKLLADAVASAKFISETKSNNLIEKLANLASSHESKQLKRNIIVHNRVKSLNERIYYNVDAINQAIASRSQIRFRYFDLDIYKKKVYRKNGEFYSISPYALFWDDEKYYAIGFYDKYNDISNFRVDRMEDVYLDECSVTPMPVDFNLSAYAKQTFSMFRGQEEIVKLRFKNNLIGVVYDKFGKDNIIHPEDDGYFHISLPINVSPSFFGWLFQFGKDASILNPTHVAKAYKDMTKDY